MSEVMEVADARAYLRAVPKNADAEWVAGLEDDTSEVLMKRRLEALRALALRSADSAQQRSPSKLKRSWLWTPALFYSLALGIFINLYFIDNQNLETYDHPDNEVALLPYAHSGLIPSTIDEKMWHHFPLQHALFQLLTGAAMTILSFRVGVAADSFVGLCGVGCGLLVVFATFVDAALLFFACAGSDCHFPFASHWTTTIVKYLATHASALAASAVLDTVGHPPGHRGHRWTLIALLPFLLYSLYYCSILMELRPEILPIMLYSARMAHFISGVLLIFKIVTQAPFMSVIVKDAQS